MTFDPIIAIHFGQRFFLLNVAAIWHSWPILTVDPGWPLYDLWPLECIAFQSGVLPAKFGSNRAFLRQIDLCITFDLWSGRFEKLTTNLGTHFLHLYQVSAWCIESLQPIAGETHKLTGWLTKLVVLLTLTPTSPLSFLDYLLGKGVPSRFWTRGLILSCLIKLYSNIIYTSKQQA